MVAILKKLGSFENYPILARQQLADGTYNLSLRYINIIRDLSMFYEWLHDSRLISNSGLPEKERRLIKHLRQSLESTDRQSFLVEDDAGAVCLFHISLISLHELYYRLPTSSEDCILTYCLTDKADRVLLFENALRLQLDYFFSFPGPGRIWVTIPVEQSTCQELFFNIGFRLKSEYRSRQQRHAISYLRRKDYITRMVTSN
ncbi:MAG: hypothetical protein Q8926_13030 [Bacteroidota bacterium]|nr:hypothetical protein [Bacteroidota bacterium]